MKQEALALLEKVVEALYQKVEGYCPWCDAKDYPVCQGYEEVKAEDAEEWHIDHCEDCIVVYLDQALAILKQSKDQPSSEFTKTIRHNLRVQGRSGDTHRLGNVYATKLIEACKIIETSEQQRKDLLDACRDGLIGISEVSVKFERGHNHKGQEMLKKTFSVIESAIAKAVKEG